MGASWQYFATWPQTAKDFAEMARTKLKMPVLSIGGDKLLGMPLGAQAKLVANDVTVVIVKNSGHWILEEQPKETTDALFRFCDYCRNRSSFARVRGIAPFKESLERDIFASVTGPRWPG